MKKINLILFVVIAFGTIALGQNKKDKPNIVFILADDLGSGDLGVYGQKIIKTPNIDRLARQGKIFSSFYAGTTVCAPSRSSLLTGQHTGHTYIRGNKEIQPEGQEPLPDSIETYAQLLQKSGYVTGAFGKWGLGMVGTSGEPAKKGFDQFFGYNCQRQSHRYYPTHLWENDKKVNLEGNDLKHKTVYAPNVIQKKTLSFLDNNKDKPFFLFIPTVLPHAELQGPDDRFLKMYKGKLKEKPFKGDDYGPDATVPGYASEEFAHATYAAMVSRMDFYIGQVLEKLDELGLTENTIIIFSSDNGSHREGGADPEFFNSSGGLRGNKRDLYEGGIRVPFIVKWPGKVKAGSQSHYVGAFWDLMPTFTELTGAQKPKNTDGISLVDELLGHTAQKQHEYLYWEFHEGGGRQAVRFGNWKGIRLNVDENPSGKPELYDLLKDPAEKNNVAAKHPEIVDKMEHYMRQAHVESVLFPFAKK